MYLAHNIELRTTASQSEYLRRCCGTMRFVYNQLVAKFKSGEKYNRRAYQAYCVNLRQTTPWMRKVSARATYEAADHFNAAVSNFFRDCRKKSGNKASPPSFKKRGRRDNCFFSYKEQFSVNEKKLRIAGLKELINMREKIRFEGVVKSVTIKPHAGKWYASFLVEVEDKPKLVSAREPSVGIDFGLKALATLSNGEVVENPRPLHRSLKLLRRRQRQVSRKFVRGAKRQSKNYVRASARVARIYKKVSDQRSAAQHKFTSDVVKRFDKITIEGLDIQAMKTNRNLSRQISDASWSSLRWQFEYKSKMHGVELVIADKYFPSSKTCSVCGHKLEKLPSSVRTFNCPSCGLSIDRDLNAAINLNNYQEKSPPIRGRLKTIGLGLCKSSCDAEPLDANNISPSLVGGSLLN